MKLMCSGFGHHGGAGLEKSRARMLHRALKVVLEDASAAKLSKLYDQLRSGAVLDFAARLDRQEPALDIEDEPL